MKKYLNEAANADLYSNGLGEGYLLLKFKLRLIMPRRGKNKKKRFMTCFLTFLWDRFNHNNR